MIRIYFIIYLFIYLIHFKTHSHTTPLHAGTGADLYCADLLHAMQDTVSVQDSTVMSETLALRIFLDSSSHDDMSLEEREHDTDVLCGAKPQQFLLLCTL